MKKSYIEEIPAQKVKHNLIICDNQHCQSVIEDNGEILVETYTQIGNGRDLIDCCSEKCVKVMS